MEGVFVWCRGSRVLGLPALCTALVFLGAYIYGKGSFLCFPPVSHLLPFLEDCAKHRAYIWVWGIIFFFLWLVLEPESLWIFAFWWTEMADRLTRKPAKRYYSFSGTSRKDSVKALRFSRSLNLKRATSEISKRQVGTEISDPFKFPLELKVVETFEKSFENLIWKFNLKILSRFQKHCSFLRHPSVNGCVLFVCVHLLHGFKLFTVTTQSCRGIRRFWFLIWILLLKVCFNEDSHSTKTSHWKD